MNGVVIWPIDALRASEFVCQEHVAALAREISDRGVWTHPIAVCMHTNLVMDGNHRLQAARLLRLSRIPVVPLSYQDERVTVRDRANGRPFDLSRLREVTDTGVLLPYKTTAHEFARPLPVTAIKLDELHGSALHPEPPN